LPIKLITFIDPIEEVSQTTSNRVRYQGRNLLSKAASRNFYTSTPKSPGPEYYLFFKEAERFIERTEMPTTDVLGRGQINFDKYINRRPFIEPKKDYSQKP
jgi:hypothetical protein